MEANKIHLPKTVGPWTRPDSAQHIDSKNIFKYMNGAGELYLSYRFCRLEVFDYISDQQDNILVELYFMQTSDDAFGLLSLDWGGDPITFGDASVTTKDPSVTSSVRALYGAGLLRIWSDTLYARVMASRETPESKQAVLTLGKAITAKRKNPPEPDLWNILPLHVGTAWKLRRDRLSFFRSYLVLNSIYYVSHENILDLDVTTEAVFAPYENTSSRSDSRRCQFLLVKYQNRERALNALRHFHEAYLPEHKNDITADSTDRNPSLFELEDGWLAYKLLNQYLVMVFECPDEQSAVKIIRENETNIPKK